MSYPTACYFKKLTQQVVVVSLTLQVSVCLEPYKLYIFVNSTWQKLTISE